MSDDPIRLSDPDISRAELEMVEAALRSPRPDVGAGAAIYLQLFFNQLTQE